MSKFKCGDLVQLISGSPIMTVRDTIENTDLPGEFVVLCTWFDGNKVLENSFNQSQLQFKKDNPLPVVDKSLDGSEYKL